MQRQPEGWETLAGWGGAELCTINCHQLMNAHITIKEARQGGGASLSLYAQEAEASEGSQLRRDGACDLVVRKGPARNDNQRGMWKGG